MTNKPVNKFVSVFEIELVLDQMKIEVWNKYEGTTHHCEIM